MKCTHLFSHIVAAALAVTMFGCSTAQAEDAKSDTPDTKQVNYDKPGFVTKIDPKDGRLWVLRPDEEPSSLHVTLVNAGPGGITIKALKRETAIEYLATQEGFVTMIDPKDGRLWVLRPDEERSNLCVTRVNAGPTGVTIKALEAETIDAYLEASN